jgi:hypothetical protein
MPSPHFIMQQASRLGLQWKHLSNANAFILPPRLPNAIAASPAGSDAHHLNERKYYNAPKIKLNITLTKMPT